MCRGRSASSGFPPACLPAPWIWLWFEARRRREGSRERICPQRSPSSQCVVWGQGSDPGLLGLLRDLGSDLPALRGGASVEGSVCRDWARGQVAGPLAVWGAGSGVLPGLGSWGPHGHLFCFVSND